MVHAYLGIFILPVGGCSAYLPRYYPNAEALAYVAWEATSDTQNDDVYSIENHYPSNDTSTKAA